MVFTACASEDFEGGGLDDISQLALSCFHGAVIIWSMQVLQFLVPLIVKTSVIELSLTDNRFPLATTSSVRGAGEPLSEDTFGQLLRLRHPTLASTRQLPVMMETTSKLHGSSDAIGTRANPIELTQGVHSVNIECSTNCVSQPTPLRWTIRNATILAEYETQAVSKAGCSDGLSSTISRATFACLLSPTGAGEVALLPSGHKPLPLVGLNRLTCAPGSLGLNLERSLLGLQSSPADALGSLADKDCTRNGQHSSACFFILCPGPPGPLLTYGEKVAVGLGTVLAVLMVVLLLRLLVVRRREKKVESAPIHDYPGELELML
ncbi:unnamed protein product [Schistocephalus solidus]|uniref:Uncharacterized protein n=1 Tax=Schistocephalus solidus TaxID=70667 RepID=A0A3P7CCF1_SCHSO|nr:unnamed protein product [Schistocephalus solidus]